MLAPLPSQSRHNHADHDRAEALLIRAETCRDVSLRQQLRDEAVVLTLDLADDVARRYRGRGVESDDLTQVGRLALVKAANGYRHRAGSVFPAYAIPTISGEIKRYFRDHGWIVRPPRRLQELRAELAQTEGRMQQSVLREPTERELADALDVDPEDIREARFCSAGYHALSLDAPGASRAAAALAPADSGADDVIADRDALGRALAQLTQREQLIVRLRFVDELTQLEIGRSIGLSQMQVSRLLTGILGRLRESIQGLAESA
ncbi:RNA polymerase sigma factor [Knoellia sinensis KCTC 19936]|uniref:RNA polymerase sigma factor n=1 Tax=Knoellia sinensis KCTC 19936 TaxID=1385520 RepID=A0A0A0J6I1_9MICO|nr:sigma-70 family RNA polymerase sigma factor [Knoellia sinensis]KGN32945.1 RNA polymerase sigma factor [Knoellia sinensis KCTC 19936]